VLFRAFGVLSFQDVFPENACSSGRKPASGNQLKEAIAAVVADQSANIGKVTELQNSFQNPSGISAQIIRPGFPIPEQASYLTNDLFGGFPVLEDGVFERIEFYRQLAA
jgi:hypothetical protein